MAPNPSKTSTARNPRQTASSENVLGPSVRIRGRLSGEGDLRIEGQVEGDVQVTGALVVDGRGSITGGSQASSVEIEGRVHGDVTADGPVAIKRGAHVQGDISGSEISLDEGASFAGRIDASFDMPEGLEDVSAAPVAVRGRR